MRRVTITKLVYRYTELTASAQHRARGLLEAEHGPITDVDNFGFEFFCDGSVFYG